MTAGVRCFAASESNCLWFCAIHYSACFSYTSPIVLKDNSNKPSDVQNDGLHKLIKTILGVSGLAIVYARSWNLSRSL